ncbi:hypothetical protein ICN10_01725 [Polynucleobacter sp. 86C-FISCH]|uniref:hypothetical protein n=1 Tax=Polynucleobacter sp. 86C-FISCH TaxID=2689101 RepID=UPI001C0DEBD4|nr:hypothetical protein [Polynucleobacter sp. 86C-FISCH]MBU3595116.1 hypothetical protein [Polynucleobacter sp. 86C-FISCH]
MSLKQFCRLHFLEFFICGVVGAYLRYSRLDHKIDYFGVLNYGISEDAICNIEHLLAGIGLSAISVVFMLVFYVLYLGLIRLAQAGNIIPLLGMLGMLSCIVGAVFWEFPITPHTNLGNQIVYDVSGVVIHCLIWMRSYKNGGAITTQELKNYVSSKMSNIQ